MTAGQRQWRGGRLLGATVRRLLGALVVLVGAVALWGAFSSDWDFSEDWDAGVFVGWVPMSFEFIGLIAVIGIAGTMVALGFLLLFGSTAAVNRLGAWPAARHRHPKEVEKHWAEILRQDPRTRTVAKRSLVEIGAPAVPKLLEVLGQPNRTLDRSFGTTTHSTAIRILDLMGPQADEPLRALLHDPDPATRRVATEAYTTLSALRARRRSPSAT